MPSSTQNTSKTRAAKKPADRKPATTRHGSTWKRPLSDLDLPSGDTCQVRRVGVEKLMKEGLLHSMDTLTSVVSSETIPKAEGKAPLDIKAMTDDPEKFDAMMEMVDKIVCLVVTEPKVLNHRVPMVDGKGEPVKDDNDKIVTREIPDEERDEDAVYADYIDLQDRIFIMNFAVGGSSDLQQFREATATPLGSIPDGEATQDKAE